MDVTRFKILLLALLLAACAPNKTAQTVVSNVTPQCQSTALENRYVVQWEDGHFSVEHAVNRQDFIDNFVSPRLALIRHADPDQIVRIKEGPVVTPLDSIPAN